MTNVASTETQSATTKQLARASILNSSLLPVAAALQLNVTFWVLVMTNFVLIHAVWLSQLPRSRTTSGTRVDFALVKRPLVAFAVLGNAALLLWGERLLAVFPA